MSWISAGAVWPEFVVAQQLWQEIVDFLTDPARHAERVLQSFQFPLSCQFVVGAATILTVVVAFQMRAASGDHPATLKRAELSFDLGAASFGVGFVLFLKVACMEPSVLAFQPFPPPAAWGMTIMAVVSSIYIWLVYDFMVELRGKSSEVYAHDADVVSHISEFLGYFLLFGSSAFAVILE